MTDLQTCPSNDALITALYGEAAADELRRIEAHVAACEACRDAWDGLRGVRSVLREWQSPEIPFHVRLVTDDAAAAPAVSPRSPLSVYATAGLAAAATLILGLAAGLANLNVRIDSTGVTFTTGRGAKVSAAAAPVSPPGAPAVTAASSPSGASATAPWRTEMAALEQRLRNELAARPSEPAALNASTAIRPAPAVIETVKSMIDEAEARQQRAMAVRFSELMRDVDTQRRTDLVSIQNGLGQLEGRTAAEAARSQELMNYIYRVSTQQPPR